MYRSVCHARLYCHSLGLTNVGVRPCITNVNNRNGCRLTKQVTTDKNNNKLIVDWEKIKNENSVVPISAYQAVICSSLIKYSWNFENHARQHGLHFQFVREYTTDGIVNKVDTFGELSGHNKYEKVEMDDDEKAEEKFVENEGRVFARHRLTPGGYAKRIKKFIEKGDLNNALQVLDMVKENRDQSTTYMYNLLLRAFAVAGNFKKCRSLYVTMKKRGVKCNDATYTSILNVCANYHHSETAIEYLESLRQDFLENNIVLNETHYNAMIKAYGRHNRIIDAFALADEMRDKKISTGEITFNSLLIGTISDRSAGLRHALIVWHLMRRHRIQPTINTYNLMLRAIRDTKFGDLKIKDTLIGGTQECRIVLNEESIPDLLNVPPTIGTQAITQIMTLNKTANAENESEIEETTSSNVPATIDSNNTEKDLIIAESNLLELPLQTIQKQNRLILFGGVTGILKRMENDGVTPNVKTMTILMELVPKSVAAENSLLKLAKAKRISLDVDFYNMLMKKRSLRRDYKGAKDVLSDIQRNGLCPDIITWGILALSCHTSEDIQTLLEGMEMTGHRLNPVIAGTLINNACEKKKFGTILDLMEKMVKAGVEPNWELYARLDNFQKNVKEMIQSKKFSRTVNHPAFKEGFRKFNMRYPTWQQQMGRKFDNKEKKHQTMR